MALSIDGLSAALSRVLRREADGLIHLADHLPSACAKACEWMLECAGRVITCGVGKSGHIARKTSGTLSSTGTPSLFLHASEAVHGDLGMVTREDVVLLYSHSGETDEIVKLFPALSAIGARTILMTGRTESSAGRLADLVIDTGVREEACSHNLAPTTSTTVMLALSDAIAVAVMEQRGFSAEDFAKFHPSGALGKRLLLTVRDVMRRGEDLALVPPEAPILEVLRAITSAGAGAACVIDESGKLVGFISDGDVRRWFLNHQNALEGTAAEAMSIPSIKISPELLAIEALEVFQNQPKKVGEIPVLDDLGRVLGLLMLKDLLRSGII